MIFVKFDDKCLNSTKATLNRAIYIRSTAGRRKKMIALFCESSLGIALVPIASALAYARGTVVYVLQHHASVRRKSSCCAVDDTRDHDVILRR